MGPSKIARPGSREQLKGGPVAQSRRMVLRQAPEGKGGVPKAGPAVHAQPSVLGASKIWPARPH